MKLYFPSKYQKVPHGIKENGFPTYNVHSTSLLYLAYSYTQRASHTPRRSDMVGYMWLKNIKIINIINNIITICFQIPEVYNVNITLIHQKYNIGYGQLPRTRRAGLLL